MNKLILTLCILISSSAFADCFIALDNDQIILQEGNCIKRNSPCSTFKIAISLMGYNEGILIDEIDLFRNSLLLAICTSIRCSNPHVQKCTLWFCAPSLLQISYQKRVSKEV